MRPDVSVLIPTFNRSGLLAETLHSILEQDLPAREIIVVDDGSTDDTESAVRQFGPRVLYHRIENSGVCVARNVAAAHATSPFLAFCDSDDLWRPDKLSLQMDLHQRNPQLEYSFTNFQILSADTAPTATKFDQAPSNFFAGETPGGNSPFVCAHPLYRQLLGFQPIWPSATVISRAKFDRIGGFREDLTRTYSEDLEFALRCVAEGPIGVIREPVVTVRKHEANFSGDLSKTILGEITVLQYVLQHHELTDPTVRNEVERAIHLRKIELVYGRFRQGEFNLVCALLKDVPPTLLDDKTRLKLRIASMPAPLAKAVQRLMLHR